MSGYEKQRKYRKPRSENKNIMKKNLIKSMVFAIWGALESSLPLLTRASGIIMPNTRMPVARAKMKHQKIIPDARNKIRHCGTTMLYVRHNTYAGQLCRTYDINWTGGTFRCRLLGFSTFQTISCTGISAEYAGIPA